MVKPPPPHLDWTPALVQRLTESQGWTLKEFSVHTGITRQTLRLWAAGKHKPFKQSLRLLDYVAERVGFEAGQ